MKLKYFLFLSLGVFLVTLIACSDESDASLLDDGPGYVSARSSQDLSISYEMTSRQSIEPTKGTLEDLCALDVSMIAVPNSETIVNTTFSANGEPCITMDESSRNDSRYEGGKTTGGTKTTFCGGVLSYTSADGITSTYDVGFDVTFYKSLAQSYYYTESQKDSSMNMMILEAKNNGATTVIKNDVLTIIEKDDEGNTTTSIYDMKNHVMITSQTTDASGKIISKTSLNYKCNPDGTIVPDFIINYKFKNNLICSDPVYTIEQVLFNNFQISL